jgi:hypothetical protein
MDKANAIKNSNKEHKLTVDMILLLSIDQLYKYYIFVLLHLLNSILCNISF